MVDYDPFEYDRDNSLYCQRKTNILDIYTISFFEVVAVAVKVAENKTNITIIIYFGKCINGVRILI